MLKSKRVYSYLSEDSYFVLQLIQQKLYSDNIKVTYSNIIRLAITELIEKREYNDIKQLLLQEKQ